MKAYRQKDGTGGQFHTLQGNVTISVEDLLAGDARSIIAVRAVGLAEDLIATWESAKDVIEEIPVIDLPDVPKAEMN